MDAPQVSIITAYFKPDFVAELYDSVVAQAGDWEWLIQCDAPLPAALAARAAADPRIHVEANPWPLGPALSRNRALLRARGGAIFCVDDDDLLPPGALVKLQAALAAAPAEAFGAFGSSDKLLPDGSRVAHKHQQPGTVAPLTIAEDYVRRGKPMVHVGCVLWRRDHLLAHGGWAGLLRSEDTNLLLAVSAAWPGVAIADVVYLYRKHGGAITDSAWWQGERPAHARLNEERFRAVRRLQQLARRSGPQQGG